MAVSGDIKNRMDKRQKIRKEDLDSLLALLDRILHNQESLTLVSLEQVNLNSAFAKTLYELFPDRWPSPPPEMPEGIRDELGYYRQKATHKDD